jgi:hypothetical protein
MTIFANLGAQATKATRLNWLWVGSILEMRAGMVKSYHRVFQSKHAGATTNAKRFPRTKFAVSCGRFQT